MRDLSSDTPVRVLHLITLFSLGGATENTLLTVQGLQQLGYDVEIITSPPIASEGDMFGEARARGVRVKVIQILKRSIHPLLDARAFVRVLWMIREGRYQIVHTHSSKAGILGRLAARLAGVPVVVHTIHGLPFHDFMSAAPRRLFILAERLGTSMSDRVISVTDTIIRKCISAGIGSPEKFVTVRSGFEMGPYLRPAGDAVALRQSYGIGPQEIVVGNIGRFNALKGHQYLIDIIPDVVKEVPNVRFVLIGSGELEEELKERVRQRGVSDRVIFTGRVDQDRIPLFIAMMDILVHTSLREGLARVLPQALAAGIPAVSFDLDGAHEVIRDGITGRLVTACDQERLCRALIELLKNPDQARSMGATGREIVRHTWTVEAMVKGVDEVYRQLLERKGLLASGPGEQPRLKKNARGSRS
jgi:glycosyltransferase involved in cell wall biosynthesis